MRITLICILQLSIFLTQAQSTRIFGVVQDARTHEPLGDFWGSGNILDPPSEVSQIINSIGKKNNDADGMSLPEGWLLLNKDLFVAYARSDSIILIPVSEWEF